MHEQSAGTHACRHQARTLACKLATGTAGCTHEARCAAAQDEYRSALQCRVCQRGAHGQSWGCVQHVRCGAQSVPICTQRKTESARSRTMKETKCGRVARGTRRHVRRRGAHRQWHQTVRGDGPQLQSSRQSRRRRQMRLHARDALSFDARLCAGASGWAHALCEPRRTGGRQHLRGRQAVATDCSLQSETLRRSRQGSQAATGGVGVRTGSSGRSAAEEGRSNTSARFAAGWAPRQGAPPTSFGGVGQHGAAGDLRRPPPMLMANAGTARMGAADACMSGANASAAIALSGRRSVRSVASSDSLPMRDANGSTIPRRWISGTGPKTAVGPSADGTRPPAPCSAEWPGCRLLPEDPTTGSKPEAATGRASVTGCDTPASSVCDSVVCTRGCVATARAEWRLVRAAESGQRAREKAGSASRRRLPRRRRRSPTTASEETSESATDCHLR